MKYPARVPLLLLLVTGAFITAGCTARPQNGEMIHRLGDEIMVCGQLIHTGTPVVLWTDPGGYDAYRVERRFVPYEKASWEATTQQSTELNSPNRYGLRFGPTSRKTAGPPLSPQELERYRGGGWDLPALREKVDQFVIHYDVCGTSRRCFQVLHDQRGLSVHFMLDIDGTIYQTLDLKERAWHATTSNNRSIGIEIANMGAYSSDESTAPLKAWYQKDETGRTRITVPDNILKNLGDPPTRTSGFVGYPVRSEIVVGQIHGKTLRQYDLTPQQYDALIKLTAALCKTFPKIKCDHPRDEQGMLITNVLPPGQLEEYEGILGHYHVQENKVDPGPAFQWDRVIDGARKIMARGRGMFAGR